MSKTISFDKKRITLQGDDKNGTSAVLALWEDSLRRQEKLATSITQGENLPGAEKTDPGLKSRILKVAGEFFATQLGGTYRESSKLDLPVDVPAYVFFEYYDSALRDALKAIGKTPANIEASEYDSVPLLVYHLLSRATALALCSDTNENHDGHQLCAAMQIFCDELYKNNLLSDSFDRLIGNAPSLFADFLSIRHPELLSELEVIVSVVNIIHKPKSAFRTTQDQLQKLENRIMCFIAATLDKNLSPDTLADREVKRTLKACEDKFLSSAPVSPRNAPSPVRAYVRPDVLALDIQARRKRVLSSSDVSAFPGPQKALLEIFYVLLDKTQVLSELVGSLDSMVTLTSWALFVTNAIDVQPLIQLLANHWRDCKGPLKVGTDHYLRGTKSWVELQRYGALGPLPPLNGKLDLYNGLATLGQADVRDLLLKTFKNDIYQIRALCSNMQGTGVSCDGLLRMEVLSVLGSAVESPLGRALPSVGGWDEKEGREFSRVNSSSSIGPVLSNEPVETNKELEMKTIEDSGLEEKELPTGDDLTGKIVSPNRVHTFVPMVRSSRQLKEEEKKSAAYFGYQPGEYEKLRLTQLSGKLLGDYDDTLSDLFKTLQWVDWHLYSESVGAVFSRYRWDFNGDELFVLKNHYRELVWWLVVLTGAQVSTLSISEVTHTQTEARRCAGGELPILANMMGRLKQILAGLEGQKRLLGFWFYTDMSKLLAAYKSTLVRVGYPTAMVAMESSSAVAVNQALVVCNRSLENQVTQANEQSAKANERATKAEEQSTKANEQSAKAEETVVTLRKTIQEMKDDEVKKSEALRVDILEIMRAELRAATSVSPSQRHSERGDAACSDDEEKAAPPPPTTTLYEKLKRKPVPDELTEDSAVDLESGPKNGNN